MASVNARGGRLYFDFRVGGQRCREYTKLKDTAANRRKMEQALRKIEAEITLGQFDYRMWFPGSSNAERVDSRAGTRLAGSARPAFEAFANTWYDAYRVSWRRSHAATVRSTLDRHLIPAFGRKPIDGISKQDVLSFRSTLAKVPGRSGNDGLSAKTINRIMQVLSQILEEAADQHGIDNPTARIRRLKQYRTDIQPFSMDEVQRILAAVRPDYRDYLTIRMFTGLRTGEVHGLHWAHVDFENRVIRIRQALVRGQLEPTKTDGSQRDVSMSQPVYEAFCRLRANRTSRDGFVFTNRKGEPFDVDNITKRLWYPLLDELGLARRRPYQMRHTAATLWLAAGENPEWVARQLGHLSTEMLFKTYSRFVPNLTRQDGSAFDRLVAAHLHPEAVHDD